MDQESNSPAIARKRKELMWVAAGQLLTLGVGFFSVRILTSALGPAGYGQLMLGVSISALVSLFLYGPLGQAAARFYSVCRERDALPAYLGAFRRIHIRLLWILLVPALAIVAIVPFTDRSLWLPLLAAALVYATVTGINHSFLSMFSGMRRRAVVALHQTGESAARLFGAVIAMLVAGTSPVVALFGYASGSLVALGSLAGITSSASQFRQRVSLTSQASGFGSHKAFNDLHGEIFRYIRPFLMWAALGFAYTHGDRWILQSVAGPAAVGVYVAIYQIGSAIPNAISSVTAQFLEPLVFERFEAGQASGSEPDAASLIRTTVCYLALLLATLVLAASAWSEEITVLIAGPEFAQHSKLLAWIVAGTGITGIAQLLTAQGLAMRRPSAYIAPKTVAATTLLAAAWFGALRLGAQGVAIALVAAAMVYLSSVLVVNARLARDL